MRENGTPKYLISVDDAVANAKGMYKTFMNSVRESHQGRMFVCEDVEGSVPEEFFVSLENAALEQRRTGTFEDQVGLLVDTVFAPSLDVPVKQTALSAINKILNSSFSFQNTANLQLLKSNLISAISTKYAGVDDIMGAFLADVQGEEGKLPESNPLKGYKSQKIHVIVFKGYNASLACSNFINSTYLEEDAARRERLLGLVSDYNMPNYNGDRLIQIIRGAGYTKEQFYIVGVSAEQKGMESGDSVLHKFLEAGAQEAYRKDHFSISAQNIEYVRGAVYNMLGRDDSYVKSENQLIEELNGNRVRSASSVAEDGIITVVQSAGAGKPSALSADNLNAHSRGYIIGQSVEINSGEYSPQVLKSGANACTKKEDEAEITPTVRVSQVPSLNDNSDLTGLMIKPSSRPSSANKTRVVPENCTPEEESAFTTWHSPNMERDQYNLKKKPSSRVIAANEGERLSSQKCCVIM